MIKRKSAHHIIYNWLMTKELCKFNSLAGFRAMHAGDLHEDVLEAEAEMKILISGPAEVSR